MSNFKKQFIRQKVIQESRNFFLKKDFQEVETPILKKELIPESYLEVFETYLLDRRKNKSKMFLSTSPEASIKKLLVKGIGNCFEITKCFRNTETEGSMHQPEFTMLEWYRVGATYKNIMKDCEDLLLYLLKKFKLPNNEIVYLGKKIDLTPPWQRISVTKSFQIYAEIDLIKHLTRDSLAKIARKKGYILNPKDSWEQIYNQIFLNEIQPHLGTGRKPTIIYDYPAQQAALARLKPTDPRFAERFEFYIAGLELGDCYTELTDPKEQKIRFKKEMRNRKKMGKIIINSDNNFLEALEKGLPECSGIAVGLDRLAMLFSNASSLAEVLYFSL